MGTSEEAELEAEAEERKAAWTSPLATGRRSAGSSSDTDRAVVLQPVVHQSATSNTHRYISRSRFWPLYIPQRFDTVDWAPGRAPGL